MTASTRRAALGAILAAPLASVSAVALTANIRRDMPSDLADPCDWGVAHLARVNGRSHPVANGPDERLEAELSRVDAVLMRVADEASATLPDLAAKARIALASDGQHLSMNSCDADRALLTVLREVITLCA